MSFCPKCRSEYVDGVEMCEECGVDLVPTLVSSRSEHDDLVEVWHTQGELEAQFVRSLLEANEIDSMFSGESVRLTHGLTVDGLAEVHILVRRGDVIRACEVIATMDGLRQCPHCQHPAYEKDARCHYCERSLED